ncbi:hypothetical protein MNV49_003435 [Pseudohyphozyma bogoriensis]|nr:hypothetical protein MNV49_003435 [Pseudohyphozyma bogoriensis]
MSLPPTPRRSTILPQPPAYEPPVDRSAEEAEEEEARAREERDSEELFLSSLLSGSNARSRRLRLPLLTSSERSTADGGRVVTYEAPLRLDARDDQPGDGDAADAGGQPNGRSNRLERLSPPGSDEWGHLWRWPVDPPPPLRDDLAMLPPPRLDRNREGYSEAEAEAMDLLDSLGDEPWDLVGDVSPEEIRARAEREGEAGDERSGTWEELWGVDDPETSRIWRNDPIDVERRLRVVRGGTATTLDAAERDPIFDSPEDTDSRRRSQAPPPAFSTRTTRVIRPASAHLDSLRSLSRSYWDGGDWGPRNERPGRSHYAGPGFSTGLGEELRRRVESDALIGQTLRTKKDCVLLYCGKRRELLPKGFSREEEDEEDGGGGCGLLVCSRGLAEVPKKKFMKHGDEEDAVSSDLPPPADRVGDMSGGKEDGGPRGSSGCMGCKTRDFGCKACGNVLGYRVIKPCNAHSCSGRTRITSTDGLLWHFRAASVTVLPRLNGILPASTIALSRSPLELMDPEVGTRMRWINVPHPQDDWEDGLVAEPKDWIDVSGNETELGWLAGIGRHSRAQRAQPAVWNTNSTVTGTWDRLNAADAANREPTSSSNPPPDPNSVFSPPTETPPARPGDPFITLTPSRSLTRSHAIRIQRSLPRGPNDRDRDRVESTLRPSSSPPPTERRVRQRVDEGEMERAVRAAGYGTGFVREGRRGSGSMQRRRSVHGVTIGR